MEVVLLNVAGVGKQDLNVQPSVIQPQHAVRTSFNLKTVTVSNEFCNEN